jgi:DNA polymerase-1
VDVIWDAQDTWPKEAYAELKTATNALGQSYGLLNTHTANLFMQRVWASEYRYSVLPCAHIHDAQYYLVRNNLQTLKWVNDNLIECMEWNELPEIQHPQVKLRAELDVFYPTWANPITLPNRISAQEISNILKESL